MNNPTKLQEMKENENLHRAQETAKQLTHRAEEKATSDVHRAQEVAMKYDFKYQALIEQNQLSGQGDRRQS